MFNFFKKKRDIKRIPIYLQKITITVDLYSGNYVNMVCKSVKIHRDNDDFMILKSFEGDSMCSIHGKDIKMFHIVREYVDNPAYIGE